MSFRSHLDPCLFVVFMHLRGNQFEGRLSDIDLNDGDPFSPIVDRIHEKGHQILFHEEYHFWQGLRLPYLFRYAMATFRQIIPAFRDLSVTAEDYHTWDCILPEFETLRTPSLIALNSEGKVFYTRQEEHGVVDVVEQALISPLDLLECAASLAEFQVTSKRADRVDPLAFRRWTKRNPAYLEPFNFASLLLGCEDIPLRSLLPLINASFYTSDPVRTFAHLLAALLTFFVSDPGEISNAFLAQQEPCRWRELFQAWLGNIVYDAAPDLHAILLGPEYFRLTLSHWVLARYGSGENYLIHPFLGPPAQGWLKKEKYNPAYSWIIDMPGWADKDTLKECRSEFFPLHVDTFHQADGQDRTIMAMAQGHISGFTSLKDHQDPESRGFIAECFTMYSAVKRASGVFYDETQRTCRHRECPHFASNFCNAYPTIPVEYAKCDFPKRMTYLINLWREISSARA
jgi:hypothetical protein